VCFTGLILASLLAQLLTEAPATMIRHFPLMLSHAEKSLPSLNEAVSHANHTTGIVKQYPNISTGKTAEC
jgi:hypothetical protein